MGLGDEILAAGQAKKLGRPVKIGDGKRITWNPLYDFIPYIDREGEWFIDYPGHRGYYHFVEDEVVWFNHEYRAEPAIIELEPIVNDFVIIEPKIKPGAPLAKQWHGYQELVDLLPLNWLEFNGPTLRGVESIQTDLITAARMIAGCRMYVGAEGLLHHLSGAFGGNAVVIIGAYSPPEVIGYDFHCNISVDDPLELGNRKRSGAMDRISPEYVAGAIVDYCRGQQ